MTKFTKYYTMKIWSYMVAGKLLFTGIHEAKVLDLGY